MGMFLAAYSGSSMNPTLYEPELMEVMPYGAKPPGVGDVAFFLPPAADRPVVHRIVRMTPAGICTRGDNNTCEDVCLLQSEHIQGRVVAAWRGQKRRRIGGGLQGRLAGLRLRGRLAFRRGAAPLLLPIYQALSRWGWIARALPAPFRPRVVVFQAGGRDRLLLLLGTRRIGRYDAARREWQIRVPFHLCVECGSLPGRSGWNGSNQSPFAGDGNP